MEEATPDQPPPSYEEPSEDRAIPLIIYLNHHAPGRFHNIRLLSAGHLLTRNADAILLPTTSTYSQAMTLLHDRVLSRSGFLAPSARHRFFCRIALTVDGEQVLLDKGSWKAAREILRYSAGARLEFWFSIVEKNYTGKGVWEGLMRRLRGLEYGQPCLVEPHVGSDGGEVV